MIPVNLGQRGTRFGFMPQLPPSEAPQRREPPPSAANAAGMAEALSQPIQVESGGWGEAVAEALAAGLRGRTARDAQLREESLMARALDREDTADAREAELQQAQIERLRAQARAAALGANNERWSDPYDLNGAQVQRNEGTNRVMSIVPRPPQPRAAASGAPELPPGFVWE